MPQRKKTREEISNQYYLSKTDILILFRVGDSKMNRIYKLAEEIDIKDLGEYRVEPLKVRMASVCKATGISLNMIKQQAKGQ